MVDIDDLKAQYLNDEFDQKDFVLSADRLVIAATASGESRPQFIDPEHPDFQATPAFLCSLASGRHLPIDFRRLVVCLWMAARRSNVSPQCVQIPS